MKKEIKKMDKKKTPIKKGKSDKKVSKKLDFSMGAMPMDHYEAKSGADTLTRAEEIKSDKALHKSVKAELAKRKMHIKKAMNDHDEDDK